MIVDERELSREEKAQIEFAFFQRFGEQKLDMLSLLCNKLATYNLS